jgi:hypothetical protein
MLSVTCKLHLLSVVMLNVVSVSEKKQDILLKVAFGFIEEAAGKSTKTFFDCRNKGKIFFKLFPSKFFLSIGFSKIFPLIFNIGSDISIKSLKRKT